MRFVDADGRLDLDHKGKVGTQPDGFDPWFMQENQLPDEAKLFFGHWAALEGKTEHKNMIGIDTGCVWGNKLTAVRLDDMQRFGVDCSSVFQK